GGLWSWPLPKGWRPRSPSRFAKRFAASKGPTWMNRAQAYRGALEAIDRILNRGGDADDVLRAVVERLHALYSWAGIRFVEGDALTLGPSAGTPTGKAVSFPVTFQGTRVAELELEGVVGDDDDERFFLERVATLVSAYCLVAWDTDGVPWGDD